MNMLCLCSSSSNLDLLTKLSLPVRYPFSPRISRNVRIHETRTAVSASKSGGFSIGSILQRCQTCGGKGAIECPGCKGTGKNKKNGNIFERWKCFDCQGFGLKSCPNCGRGGLTPEQRGER